MYFCVRMWNALVHAYLQYSGTRAPCMYLWDAYGTRWVHAYLQFCVHVYPACTSVMHMVLVGYMHTHNFPYKSGTRIPRHNYLYFTYTLGARVLILHIIILLLKHVSRESVYLSCLVGAGIFISDNLLEEICQWIQDYRSFHTRVLSDDKLRRDVFGKHKGLLQIEYGGRVLWIHA
jgi:hypothetical protein